MKVLIIGGVAAGPKAASRINRLVPNAEVTLIEKGNFLSYAGCGLPYFISGEVREEKELMSTAAGAVRDPAFFRSVKKVHVEKGTEAVEIDRVARRVRVCDVATGADRWLEYDKLLIATGATPVVPPLPGVDRENVLTLHSVPSAARIREMVDAHQARNVVVIGGGLIGVEVTEALADRGCHVTIVEMLPQILSILDWEMAWQVANHMASKGVHILTETRALALEGDSPSPARATSVRTSAGDLPADLVILAIGVRPNSRLAKEAGLEIGQTGGIRVDEFMRTSDPDIFAAGDCVEMRDRLTGAPCYVPLGSTANKQGRIAAANICGGHECFPGVIGSAVCKVFDFSAARTGLTEKAARAAGLDVITVLVPGADKAHFMPQARTIMLKLVVERATGRLMGVQGVGPGDAAKRIDVAATAITAGMTVEDVANLDLAYAPPFAPAMDNLITAANVARNKLDGLMVGIGPQEVHARLEQDEDFLFLDVRSPAEYERAHLPKSTLIPLNALRDRLNEIPRESEVITYCQISLRGYEAARILSEAGFANVKVMDGGITMWPYGKVTAHA